VWLSQPTFPGCHVWVRPVAVFWMADEKGPDAKVLCVSSHDPRFAAYKDIEDLPEHLLDEVGNFFEVYKLLEPNKDTTVKGWEGRSAAEAEIQAALARHH
jgi:inorganic pyrophosphatase